MKTVYHKMMYRMAWHGANERYVFQTTAAAWVDQRDLEFVHFCIENS